MMCAVLSSKDVREVMKYMGAEAGLKSARFAQIRSKPTLSRVGVPRPDKADHKLAVRLQAFVLGADSGPKAEEAADSLLVFADGGTVKFATECRQKVITELFQELRRRLGVLSCGLCGLVSR